MMDMIKTLILVLALLITLEHIIKQQADIKKPVQKYEYKGKYKDPKRERIVEHIGE